MGFHKSTLVARGADSQLDPSCVSAPLEANVDLFICVAERLLKSACLNSQLAGELARFRKLTHS